VINKANWCLSSLDVDLRVVQKKKRCMLTRASLSTSRLIPSHIIVPQGASHMSLLFFQLLCHCNHNHDLPSTTTWPKQVGRSCYLSDIKVDSHDYLWVRDRTGLVHQLVVSLAMGHHPCFPSSMSLTQLSLRRFGSYDHASLGPFAIFDARWPRDTSVVVVTRATPPGIYLYRATASPFCALRPCTRTYIFLESPKFLNCLGTF
jgi:hypothetical protein